MALHPGPHMAGATPLSSGDAGNYASLLSCLNIRDGGVHVTLLLVPPAASPLVLLSFREGGVHITLLFAPSSNTTYTMDV
jgi:hypothetical protein